MLALPPPAVTAVTLNLQYLFWLLDAVSATMGAVAGLPGGGRL
jgi:hypothetical protein